MSLHESFSLIPDGSARALIATDQSLTAKTDIYPVLWENLKRLLFATVTSLQGVITNIMHSRLKQNGSSSKSIDLEFAEMAAQVLEILRTVAFVSVRFGYRAFDEWNFIYLSSVDIISAYPLHATSVIEKQIPDIQSLARTDKPIPANHPAAKADTLFFLDTLEHLIPILQPHTIHNILPIIRQYLSQTSDITLRAHLESSHSVFLAILARGDILHDEIFPYITQVYNAFPQALTPQQFRLAFSTVVKLLPSLQHAILTDLLRHVNSQEGMGEERDVYLLAFVDCLPWIEEDAVEFWLDQLVVALQSVNMTQRDSVVKRLWECISGEMGGERGLKAVSWWINGGNAQLTSKL
jgi:hypothetical protein